MRMESLIRQQFLILRENNSHQHHPEQLRTPVPSSLSYSAQSGAEVTVTGLLQRDRGVLLDRWQNRIPDRLLSFCERLCR